MTATTSGFPACEKDTLGDGECTWLVAYAVAEHGTGRQQQLAIKTRKSIGSSACGMAEGCLDLVADFASENPDVLEKLWNKPTELIEAHDASFDDF